MASIKGVISAVNTKFIRAIDECESKVGKFKKSIGRIGAAIGFAFAIGKVRQFIDELDELSKRARDLNLTTAELKALQHEAKHAGLAVGEFDNAMKSFVEKMGAAASGTGTEATQLAKLGVSFTDANGQLKTVNTLLYDVAEAFKAHAGGAESAKIATDLFGGSGLKMVRVLEQGSEALRAQVKEFEDFNKAGLEAEAVNDIIEDSSSTLGKWFTTLVGGMSVTFNQFMYWLKGESYSAKVQDDMVKRAKNAIAQQEEAQKKFEAAKRKAEEKAYAEEMAYFDELNKAEKAVTNAELKRQAEIDKVRNEVMQKRADMTFKALTLEEKINLTKEKLARDEKQLATYQSNSIEYAKQELEIVETRAKLKDLEESNAKAQEEAAKKAEDTQREKISLEKKLQDLIKARAKLEESIVEKTKKARLDVLESVGARAGGTAVGRHVQRAKTAQEKAQQALAEGRYSDYFRQTDKAKTSMEKAEAKRKEQLTKKADEYERLGNKEGAKRMRDEIEKEGFGKNKAEKEDIEKLKEIEEHTKETKDALEKLLEGLKG